MHQLKNRLSQGVLGSESSSIDSFGESNLSEAIAWNESLVNSSPLFMTTVRFNEVLYVMSDVTLCQ